MFFNYLLSKQEASAKAKAIVENGDKNYESSPTRDLQR